MRREELAPHVDELIRVLGKDAERKEIEEYLERCIINLRLSIEQAKRVVLKRFGARNVRACAERKNIAELTANEQSVEVVCYVKTVNIKEIVKAGQKRKILYGLLSDDTGTLPFTAWEPEKFDLKQGDHIQISNAYTREWSGAPQLYLSARTTVTKLEATSTAPSPEVAIRDLKEGMTGISVTGRIISLQQKTVRIEDIEKQVYSGIIADSTGKARFSAWENFGLVPDAVVKIQNAYVKSWRGLPDIVFDNRSCVEFLKAVSFPSSAELSAQQPLSIEEALRSSGVDVQLSGIVIDLKQGSGLIFRCPECRRVTQRALCRVHEKVEPVPDLRVKAVLDDGTGTITIVMNKELTERVLGKSLDECLRLAQKELNQDAVQQLLAELILLRPIFVRGNITRDSFGPMLLVNELNPLVEVMGRAEQMLAEIERWMA